MAKANRGKGGKDVGNGKVLIKSSHSAGMRRMQCTRCHRSVAPSKDDSGKIVYRCTCGSTFRGSSMQ